jgi:hypothetical protein
LVASASRVYRASMGWHEYQKIEAYRVWAEQFQRAKYDLYAVLGQAGTTLTWGKPSRQAPVDLQTVSLEEVAEIHLLVDGQRVDLNHLPEKGRSINLEFVLKTSNTAVKIPFTQVELAAKWGEVLLEDWKKLQTESRR